MPDDSTPRPESKKIGCRGCLLVLLAGCFLFLIFCFFWVLTAISPQVQPGQPLFEPNVAANAIEGPLNSDGDIDYVEFVNQDSSAGVTPETNAMVPLARALGPSPEGSPVSPEFFERLGIATLPNDGNYFTDFLAWHRAQTELDKTKNSSSELSDSHDASIGSNDESPEQTEFNFAYAYGKSRPEAIWDFALEQPWNKSDLPTLQEYLDQNETSLALAAEAATRPHFYYPKVTDAQPPTMYSVTLPHLQQLRGLAQTIIVRSNLRLAEGKIDDAIGDAKLAIELGERISDSDFLVEEFVSLAMRETGIKQLARLAQQPALDKEHLLQLKSIAAGLQIKDVAMAMLGDRERLGALDAVHSIFRHGANAESPVLADMSGPAMLTRTADAEAAMKFVNQFYEKVAKLLPQYKTDPNVKTKIELELDAIQNEVSDPGRNLALVFSSRQTRGVHAGKLFVAMYMPAIAAVADGENRVNSKVLMLQLIVELELFKRENGRYPENLAELTPDHIEKIPADPASFGNPFVYRPDGHHYQLYSLGGNQKDDGGISATNGNAFLQNDDHHLISAPTQTWQDYLDSLSNGGVPLPTMKLNSSQNTKEDNADNDSASSPTDAATNNNRPETQTLEDSDEHQPHTP